jgi:hypothetical protein
MSLVAAFDLEIDSNAASESVVDIARDEKRPYRPASRKLLKSISHPPLLGLQRIGYIKLILFMLHIDLPLPNYSLSFPSASIRCSS